MSKETSAWMPLYVSDYLKDTMHLSTVEHGAYFLLIMHAWTHEGALPLDETRLARIAGLNAKEWKAARGVILEFFVKAADAYRHARIDREIGKAEAMVEQRRSAGKASAAARKAQRKAQREGNGRSTGVATNDQRNGRPSPSQEANASPRAGVSELMIDLCNIASMAPPDPGCNFDKHKAALTTVEGWIEAGADPDLIRETLTQRCANLRTSPRSLAFFDKPVREAAENRKAEASRITADTGSLIDQILKRNAA